MNNKQLLELHLFRLHKLTEPCSKRIGNNVQGQQAGPALGTDGYQDQKPLFTLLCRGDNTVADEQPYQLAENT